MSSIYKTLRRSISGKPSERPGQSTSSEEYTKWIHPPDTLIRGEVTYSVKFLGSQNVVKHFDARGEARLQALNQLSFQRTVQRMEQPSENVRMKRVEISISTKKVAVTDSKTREVIFSCRIHDITQVANDSDVLSFIRNDHESIETNVCYAFFMSEKHAKEIKLTLQEAAYIVRGEMEDRAEQLRDRRINLTLHRRIAELENENKHLKMKLSGISSPAPGIPDSPIPLLPPLSFLNSLEGNVYTTLPLCSASPLQPIPVSSSNGQSSMSGPPPSLPPPVLAPPPPIASRRKLLPSGAQTSTESRVTESSTTNSVQGNSNTENVFDDLFNPRLKKEDRNGVTTSTNTKSAVQIQGMIDDIDSELEAMRKDFKDFDMSYNDAEKPESEYGVPSDLINPKFVGLTSNFQS